MEDDLKIKLKMEDDQIIFLKNYNDDLKKIVRRPKKNRKWKKTFFLNGKGTNQPKST
jgi:hypothetical protein